MSGSVRSRANCTLSVLLLGSMKVRVLTPGMETTSAEALLAAGSLLAEAGTWLRATNISLPSSLTSVLDTADLATTSGSLA